MNVNAIQIKTISIGDKYLEEAIQLWRINSDTLGFMPKGGFEQAATAKTLFGAVDQNDHLWGYVLFRRSRGGIKIAHLCVKSDARGQGTARMLVEYITKQYPDTSGLGLWCRDDYAANKMWPHLGFSPRARRRGRGSEGGELVLWFKDHANPDLFSFISHGARVEAVMDSCVYFDIVDGDQSSKGEESRALVSDWLEDSVRLLLSQEVRNDMHRDPDEARRNNREKQLGSFDELRIAPDAYDAASAKLKTTLPIATDDQTRTDYGHLAWTLASGVPHFLTRDGRLLKHKTLLQNLGLCILTPGEFIRRIDELDRKDAYRPEEIAGAKITFFKVHDDHMALVEKLAETGAGESSKSLVNRVRTLMATPRQSQVRIAVDLDGSPLALIGEESLDSEVPVLSVVRFSKSSVAPTLARFIAHKLIHEKSGIGLKTYKVSDPRIPDVFTDALTYCGFNAMDSGGLVRQCRGGLLTLAEAQQAWTSLPINPIPRETQIWPAKIIDAVEPVYMIPINPSYASSLFDHGLASQTLFCDKPEVLMQDECVYYSATRINIEAPGRIVWYVSQGDGYEGTSAARACSFLIETVRGPAKTIYRQFKRFGVFDWRQIQEIAGGPEKEITAIRFANTELFPNSIPLKEMLPDLGSAPAGPRPLSYDLFLKLYRLGTGL
jgi:GNAT superfamily N-acetyltransferase